MTDRFDLDPGRTADGAKAATRISAVILAAGMSKRMGERPKLLLDIGGEPMIHRTLANILAIAPVETIVVTGYRAAEIEATLAGLPVRCVRNQDYERGQPISVAVGVASLAADCDAVVVVMGDQPLVTAGHLRALVTAYEGLENATILVPHHAGRRGNPILFAARHIPAVIGRGIKIGCRRLIEAHDADVARTEFDSDAYTFDCDTPEDYQALLGRLEAVA